LNKQKSDIDQFLSETEKGIDAVGQLTEEVKTEIAHLRSRVGKSIRDSDRAIFEMNKKVANRLELLETEKKHLIERLKSAHRIFP